jgi:N-formylglutamate amidohydrolase
MVLTTHPAPPSSPRAILVDVQTGTMPIVLTAPHGGSTEVPGVPPRTSGQVIRDFGTLELALGVAAELQHQLGQRPYTVAARFHRRSIDANRPPDLAFELAEAEAHYAAYHDAVRCSVDDVRRRWQSSGILIDIHGQSDDPGTIHRGTQNGRTMRRVLERSGDVALVGPTSVLGRLRDLGYPIHPSGACAERESPRFNGGYTVQTYGSHQPDGIDALQIELGSSFRRGATLSQLVVDLADAIATYYQVFLSPTLAR